MSRGLPARPVGDKAEDDKVGASQEKGPEKGPCSSRSYFLSRSSSRCLDRVALSNKVVG